MLVAMLLVNARPFMDIQAHGDGPGDNPIEKNAYINGSITPNNGTVSDPTTVALEDDITYTITAVNEKGYETGTTKYDVLFVLDWSGSMDLFNMNSDGVSALIYERDIMLDMCDFVIANYPGSRIAVMGMNATLNNYNDPDYTNIQYQTDFLDATQYAANRDDISAAFVFNPEYIDDDNGTFLKAAIDKMAGYSTSFGGSTTGGAETIIPRTGSDLSERIPVIIHISDFQIREAIDMYWNNSGQLYWSEVLKGYADSFASLFPEAILQTVRLDHSQNTDYNVFCTPADDDLMTTYVSPAGRSGWGFTKVPYGTSYASALDLVKNALTSKAPVPTEQGALITDVVPEGLDVDTSSISHGGVYNPVTRTISWDLTGVNEGEVTVSFTAKVKQAPKVFANTASVSFYDDSGNQSNTTYHQSLSGGPGEPGIAAKNAFINGSGTAQNGSSGSPVQVALDSAITYTITATNDKEHSTVPAQYDVLFVLDWSESMGREMYGSQNARLYERDIMLDMCDYVIATYPGSRIAVIAMNCPSPYWCTNNPLYTNIQFETDFLDATQFAAQRATISAAFNVPPEYGNDDNASFLKAATDKMAGLSTSYGSSVTGGATTIIPRTGSELDKRIPVVMVLTDFQITEEIGSIGNQSGQLYWSEVMKGHADRFESLLPKGILQMVRLDHSYNSNYSSPLHPEFDTYMTNYVVTASRTNWGFTKVPNNTPYATALISVKNTFISSVPFFGVQGTIITDVVPDGLEVNTGSISHGGVYNPATRTISWDLSEEDEGELTVSFTATVKQLSKDFVNTATVTYYDNSSDSTNTTYHQSPPPLPKETAKNAYINGSLTPQNGSSSDMVLVYLEDEITYKITAVNEKEMGVLPAVYDVLFVLDWSGSMGNNMNSSGTSARFYQRQVMLDMCDYVIANYPGSRVAVMGLNSLNNCYNDPDFTYIQFQTDFLDDVQYATNRDVISAAFDINPLYSNDDDGSFLQSAIDKMAGLSTTYGSSLGGNARTVTPRTGSDLDSRIPVIMLLSDFQLSEESSGTNNSGVPYWSNVMKAHADRFDSLFPNGVLQMVRLDHTSNFCFNTPIYDNLMETYLSPAGRAHWGFTKVAYNTSYTSALDKIKNDFNILIPYEGEIGTIITDVVPEGLEVDPTSISHGGTYDPAMRTITWDLSEEADGEITVSFKTTVKQTPKEFGNTAIITYYDDSWDASNTTYHRTLAPTVTEYFRELGNESNVLDSILDGNVLTLGFGDPYSPASGIPPETIILAGVTYNYYGYRVGSGPIDTTLRTMLPGVLISSVINHTEVTYLFERVVDTDFVFYKVDENDDPMEGVKFLLYACTDSDPATHNHPWLVSGSSSDCWGDAIAASSDVDGLVEFFDLPPGSYMLVEVETHPGYQLPQGQWLIEIDDSLVIDITAHGSPGSASVTLPPAFKLSPGGDELLLPNYRQMVMPRAGGPGLIHLTVLGVVLFGDGILFAILFSRRGRRMNGAHFAITTMDSLKT